MRAFLFAVLAAFTPLIASGQSHPRPKGILNANWGASRAEVITMLQQHGATVPEEDPGGDQLVVAGGSFAGQEALSWNMEFFSGKLIAGSVLLKPSESASVLYRDLKQQLIAKYGPHSGEGKITGSREERRARSTSGLPAPKKGTAVTWKFTPTLQAKDSLSITCEMAPPADSATEDESLFLVTVRYANETMKAQASKAAATPSPEPPSPPKGPRTVKGDCL